MRFYSYQMPWKCKILFKEANISIQKSSVSSINEIVEARFLKLLDQFEFKVKCYVVVLLICMYTLLEIFYKHNKKLRREKNNM